jgi:hypothetical protein
LPNISKWFERIIHNRILKWCDENKIETDEQSGFMKNRRLQTRILSLTENLRLTTTACNRAALTIFVDFLSAFDNMFYPVLIKNLHDLKIHTAFEMDFYMVTRQTFLYLLLWMKKMHENTNNVEQSTQGVR